MAPRPRARGTALALLVAVAACGDDGDGDVSFADGTCDVLADMVAGFEELEEDVQGLGQVRPTTTEEAAALFDDVQRFFAEAITVLEAARGDLDDLDGSGTDGGEDFVEVFAGALDGAVATLEDADDAFDLDAEDFAGFDADAAARLAELGDALGRSFTEAFAPIRDERFAAVFRAVDDAERCRDL